MPHQCLKCGKIFEEGSSQLLRGCPSCGGNRFFFTKEPLGDEERSSITNKIGEDINSKIIDLLGSEKKDIIKKSGEWVTINPKEIRKVVKQQLPKKEEDSEAILDDEKYRKKSMEKLKTKSEHLEPPETIDIQHTGKYKIDLKGLLEEEPIIIQKDGSYSIHLPSVFKMIDKDKK